VFSKTNKPLFISGFFILILLFIASFAKLKVYEDQSNFAQLSINLSFGTLILTGIAVCLAMFAIAFAIKKADITVYIGDKIPVENGISREIVIANEGNTLGNLAHIHIEIKIPQSCPITFEGTTNFNFVLNDSQDLKLYQFDQPDNPIVLYPVKYLRYKIGSIIVPNDNKCKIKLQIQTSGIQGYTKNNFKIST
jgi:hypothetical protein